MSADIAVRCKFFSKKTAGHSSVPRGWMLFGDLKMSIAIGMVFPTSEILSIAIDRGLKVAVVICPTEPISSPTF